MSTYLNPGDYCGKRDKQYEISAMVSYESGRIDYVHLIVNARSPSHALKLARKAGYIAEAAGEIKA